MKRILKTLIPETSAIRLGFHRLKALCAAIRYGFPATKLTVISMTGTDGKTTTVGMIAHMLNACGLKTAAISTAFFRIGDDIRWNATQKTSPSPFTIQRFLRDAWKSGCTHAVIECSSHGLLQGRVNHTYPLIAGITNVSEEHLDYHGSMENYIEAKSMLFRMLPLTGSKVLHYSDRSFSVLCNISSARTILYDAEETQVDSRTGAPLNLWTEELTNDADGLNAVILWKDKGGSEERFPVHLGIPGKFNLENALCAVGCILALPSHPNLYAMVAALASFKGVPGRMEQIKAGQNFSVFIDFTVTPKSYEATLRTLRSMLPPGKRLLVLAGSCGDRMKEKRPVIGNVCSLLAEVSVITNEDPYTENPESIIDEVLSGVSLDVPIFRDSASVPDSLPAKCCIRISDRLKAIRYLLQLAKKDDIVLLCGKGSDTTMMTDVGQIPWNERAIVTAELRTLYPQTPAL